MDYFDDGHTLSDTLLAFLLSGRSTKAFYRIRRELVLKREEEASARTALYRLEKRGFVSRSDDGWKLTDTGKKHIEDKDRFDFISSPFQKGSVEKSIVSFDIPQTHRRERDWVREQLKIFGYRMLQQSLWVGPGPLPKEFTERLQRLGVKKGVRVFKVG